MNAQGNVEPASHEAKPEGLFSALFVVSALGLVVAFAIALIGMRIQRGDSDRLALELLPKELELPYGFLHSGGVAVANDQRWVRYARSPSAPAELDGQPLPEVILLARYRAVLAVERQFGIQGLVSGEELDRRKQQWSEHPEQGFDALLAKGNVPVGTAGTLETDYIAVRSFSADGSFRDVVRVNLTTERDEGQMLVANWPLNVEGADIDLLRPILDLLQLEL